MRLLIATIFATMIVFSSTSTNAQQITPWTPGTFEIRVFNVGQGDSQLIIFPSGFSILIDVREPSWNSSSGAELIAGRIQAVTGARHVNVGVLSHLHLDHIGYAGQGGFWSLLEEQNITFDRIIDRAAGSWVDGHGGGTLDGNCDHQREIVWTHMGTQSGTPRRWLCYATNPANTRIFPIRQIAQLGSTTQIDPPDGNATVEIIQADAANVLQADGVTPVQGDHTTDNLPPSENDYSIALKISFGRIDYATAGDADGEYATSGNNYSYNDVESEMAPRFGPVEILHADHHGSSHSNNQTYLDTLDPEVSLISCGPNSYGHPGQAVLTRLLATSDVYLTATCDTTRDYQGTHIVDGDIIIRSIDGINYTVNGNPYIAPDNIRGPRDIVINELFPNPSSGNMEWVELYNPTNTDIDISGMWVDDIARGRAPTQITQGSTIVAGGFWTLDTHKVFNNRGDSVRLLLPDRTTVVDSFSYGRSTRNESFHRSPDGGAWVATSTAATTRGAPNP